MTPTVKDKSTAKELRGKLTERREKLHKVFEEAGQDMDMSKVESLEGDSAAKVEAINAINDEIDDLAKQLEPIEAEEATLNRARREADQYADSLKGHPLPPQRAGEPIRPQGGDGPSIAEAFFEAGGIADGRGRDIELEGFDVQGALFETGEGWEPEVIRSGRFVDKAVRPIQIIDVIPPGTTTQSAVKYMEETVFTNAAAETGEGEKYKEATLKVEEKESPVRKITVWLPVSDEQLEDEPQAQGYINRRLPFMLRQRLDGQIPSGDGEGNNLRGFLNTEGIQTQAKATDPAPDAAYKAMVKTETPGQAMVGPVLINPLNWQPIRLLRTADGIYIWGSPSEPGPERMWGQRVVKAQGMPEGTALTGDFANFAELSVRAGLEMKLSDSHGDQFIEGVLAIRARIRVALVVYRPAAFVEITGLTT